MNHTQVKSFVPGVQFLRVVACLMIAVHHLPFDINTIGTLGRSAVGIFIALSGFLAGIHCYQNDKYEKMPTVKNGILTVKGKLKKFYWIYLISFFLMVIIDFAEARFISHESYFKKENIIKMILYLSLTQIWVPIDEYIYSIVPPCWYLSMIMTLYFCQGWLCYLCNRLSLRRRVISVAVVFIFLTLITIALRNNDFSNYILYFSPFTRIMDFWIAIVIGNIYAEYKERLSSIRYGTRTSIQIIAVIFFVFSLFLNIGDVWQYNLFYFAVGLSLLVVWAMDGGVSNISKNPLLLSIASATDIMFIIHTPLFVYTRIANNYLFHINTYIISVVSIVELIIAAYFCRYIKDRYVSIWERE